MLPSGQITIEQGPVFQSVERATHWINHDPKTQLILISLSHCILIYPVPSFEKLGLGKYYQNLFFFFFIQCIVIFLTSAIHSLTKWGQKGSCMSTLEPRIWVERWSENPGGGLIYETDGDARRLA